MGYDPMKKKYTSIWVDSMSYTMTTMTGTYDEATKTYTGLGESMGPGGEIEKMKEVTVDKDSDTRVFTMYKMLDGKESPLFTITYKRRK